MLKVKATLGAILLSFCIAGAASAWDLTQMNKQIDQTNFLVNDNCSATMIDAKSGYILTANQCIRDQYEVVEHEKIGDDGIVHKEKIRVARPGTVSQILFSGPSEIQRNSYVFKIKATDSALDLALLEVQTKMTGEGSGLACDDLRRGDKVFAVGNSFSKLYSTLTSGIVSSLQRSYHDLNIAGQLGDLTDNGEHGLVQHSAPIVGGNSGGALYDDAGKLVGVNVRSGPPGFSFSVPLSDIKKFLKDSGVEVIACANDKATAPEAKPEKKKKDKKVKNGDDDNKDE